MPKRLLPMLTALAIEKLKPREKQYKVSDGNRLASPCEPAGSKLWRLRYASAAKKRCVARLFPEVSLADARGKRDEAQKLLANGIDPSDQKKQDKLVAEVAGKQHVRRDRRRVSATAERKRVTQVDLSKNRWLLLDLASPLAKRPIAKSRRSKFSSFCKSTRRPGGEKRRSGCGVLSGQCSAWLSPPFGLTQTRRTPARSARCTCCDASSSDYR